MNAFNLNPNAIPFLIVSLLIGITGISVFIQSPKSALNRVFFAFTTSIFIWLFFTVFMLILKTPEWIILFAKIIKCGVSFISVTAFHYTSVWLGYSKKQKKIIVLGYFLASLFDLMILSTPWIVYSYKVHSWGNYTLMEPWGGGIFLIFFAAYMLGIFLNLISGIRNAPTPLIKKQATVVMVGFLIAYLSWIDFLPCFGISAYPIGSYAVLCLVAAFLFTMRRYSLFVDLHKMAAAFQKEKLAAIGILSMSINHEIRNPLYVIQGLAQSYILSLKEGFYKNDAESILKAQDILSRIENQSTRAMAIMKRFSLFAKRGVDDSITLQDVDLKQVVDTVLPLVHHEMALEKIEFVIKIPEQFPPLYMDMRHLEEVLFNLIMNACQAIKSKGNQIILSAEEMQDVLLIKIQDNGPGIEEDRLQSIFDPFYSTKSDGTGLGLYITQQFVERNRGRITVTSKINEGTIFTLSFPKQRTNSQATSLLKKLARKSQQRIIR